MRKFLVIICLLFIGRAHAQFCFSSNTNYPIGAAVARFACVDINGDGFKDVLTIRGGSIGFEVLLGNGTGSFTLDTNYVPGTSPWMICAGDFNGDGLVDVAVSCMPYPNPFVSIMLGTESGRLGAPLQVFTPTEAPSSMAIVDVNNDSKPDIVASNMNTQIGYALLGDGAGNFSVTPTFPIGHWARSLVTADFNGDGKADVATTSEDSSYVSVLVGDGAGSFTPVNNFHVGTGPYCAVAADLNNDGKMDIATANRYSNNVSVLLGDGTGQFAASVNYPVGSGPYYIDFGDMDNDGNLDLLTANWLLNNVSILKGSGTGTFASPYNVSSTSHPAMVNVSDVNNDGGADILVTSDYSTNLTSILNCTPTSTCVVSVAYTIYPDTVPGYWIIVPQYSSQVDSAVWSWGDGTQTIGLYPSHTYTVPPGFYNKCVTAFNNCGDSSTACANDSIYRVAQSSMIYVNVQPFANAVHDNGKSDIRTNIFPNPASQEVYMESDRNCLITLLDLDGRSVVNVESPGRMKIDVSGLADGVYCVQMRFNERVIYKKLVIQH